jgi:plastocyanin
MLPVDRASGQSLLLFIFASVSLSVAPGALVGVTNPDTVAHTATAAGGQSNSGRIGYDLTRISRLSRKKGVYHHYCFIHQFMVATLQVS